MLTRRENTIPKNAFAKLRQTECTSSIMSGQRLFYCWSPYYKLFIQFHKRSLIMASQFITQNFIVLIECLRYNAMDHQRKASSGE